MSIYQSVRGHIVIKYILTFLLLTAPCYAKTLDAGNIVTEVDAWGEVDNMYWPKGPNQENRVWRINMGLAYAQEASYTNYTWSYDDDSITYDGFFENTNKADQEVRTISTMKIDSKYIRMRTSYRAYKEGSSRDDEIEMVYEYRNQTLHTLNDFYYGLVIDIWVPYIWNYGNWEFDAGGNLIYTSAEENEGANYVDSKNMFWFGYKDSEFYVAVLVAKDSTDRVHTASLHDYSSNGWNPNFTKYSEGTKPSGVIDMSEMGDPVVFYSLKQKAFEPGEKIYMKVVVAFAKTAEQLVGSVNRILEATKVETEPIFTSTPKEGSFQPPQANSGGGCFLNNVNPHFKKVMIEARKKKLNPPGLDFELLPLKN